MARINVNPTRMELKKLKARLKTATRGHKLLKDKSDEMIRRFSVLLKRNKTLRDEVEKELSSVLKEFAFAKALLSSAAIENAFMMPTASLSLNLETASIMNVAVPKITVSEQKSDEPYPYAFTGVTSEADYSVKKITEVIKKLVELAEVEKQVAMLADEIEKNKRRVNALEYVMIPQLNETIKYITSKLDENERAATTRLMKVKDMIAERA
ncbi:MAG: V-type ATP synthase subunit D [Candidatus Borkfalkiaceae bacterium]|nr:V-type ATP synthase subunit D [Christensenellaceae bacterium]